MNDIKITLLNHTPLWVCSNAIRTCYQSFEKGDKGGEKDKELIERVGNKMRHASTLEHLFYNFYIEGISRACLQELARHRIASLSVKSTRYTLKELLNESNLSKNFNKYLVESKIAQVNHANVAQLVEIKRLLKAGAKMDDAKYLLPESYKTSLIWTINARSLQNFLALRSSLSALPEIQELALNIYRAIPSEHKFIFKNIMEGDNLREN